MLSTSRKSSSSSSSFMIGLLLRRRLRQGVGSSSSVGRYHHPRLTTTSSISSSTTTRGGSPHHNDQQRGYSSFFATRSTADEVMMLLKIRNSRQQQLADARLNNSTNLLLSGQNRFFSGSSSGGDGDDEKKKKKKQQEPFSLADDDDDDNDDDPFGLEFLDGDNQGKIGPTDNLPPKYKRDTATGRWHGTEIEAELTSQEKQILKSDPIEKDQMLIQRMERHWAKKTQDEQQDDLDNEMNQLGERIRSADMGLNVLGRSVQAQQAAAEDDEDSELDDIDDKFSQNLTQDEFQAFKGYMKKKYNIDNLSEDEIPVIESDNEEQGRRRSFGSGGLDDDDDSNVNPDDSDLALKWMTTRGQREMDDLLDDDPYSDLMPGDLTPTRLVNRKQAKPLPSKLLHHNNLELLRQYLTPTGQVMNRVQTRLGARDQRKVAKLVKRARALGLIPYQGQFKIERHGWIYESDINDERDWEKELIDRGLVIERKQQQQQQRRQQSSLSSEDDNNKSEV